MFTLCYATNNSPRYENDKSHLNPIYHKLGGRKNKSKVRQFEAKDAETCPTKESVIYTYAPSNQIETSKHIRINSDLVQSRFFKSTHLKQSCMTSQKARIQTSISQVEPSEKQIKYSQLQQKYIGVLERANFYLQKALSSKQKKYGDAKNKSKSQSKSKIGTQLRDLKDRLNNIDLSAIKKLATIKTKAQNGAVSSREDKQNKENKVINEFRSKMQ